MNMQKPLPMIALAIMAIAAYAQPAAAGELEAKFNKVAIGLTREAVLAVIGPPDAEIAASTLGVPHARLTWLGSDERTYVAIFLAGRVVATKTCAAVADC